MKQKDVKIGETYTARISGNLVDVKVLAETVSSWSNRTKFRCTNLKTGREVVRSAAALRPSIKQQLTDRLAARIEFTRQNRQSIAQGNPYSDMPFAMA